MLAIEKFDRKRQSRRDILHTLPCTLAQLISEVPATPKYKAS